MKSRWTSLLLSAAAAMPCFAAVDYAREVKPLLAERCYQCHGARQQKSGLRLDTAALALKGGENGPAFKSGRSRESLMIQTTRGTHDSIAQMPYKKPALTSAQIDLLAKWIDEGAKSPANEKPETARHWAFIPPQRAPPPRVTNHLSRITTPIDAFILARLEKEKVSPSPEADRATLIRRVSLDLIGLPPTPSEVDEFVNDQSQDAYEKIVERLLASRHYGERWGRWWLDAARYADSNGYSIDAPRQIWKYRDWVVAALNRDMPFDQFATWQLAGDLIDTNSLPPLTSPLEPLIATGFNRNTQINQEGGIDPEQFRVESVMDRVNTFGTVFLGLTIGCAQCHDHKFDPITQREYYQLFAFFNNTVQDGHGSGTPGGVLQIPGEAESGASLKAELDETRADLERYLDTKGSDVTRWEQALTDEQRAKLKASVKAAMKLRWSERKLDQKRAVYAAFKSDETEFKSRNAKLARLERSKAKPVTTLVMQELPAPRETHVFIKGDFTRPADVVQPGVPAALHPLGTARPSRADFGVPPKSSGQTTNASGGTPDATRETRVLPNRLDLARWLAQPENPLTARVIVNRVWQQYFGRGLVETENDFGSQGALPSHPELLDWLACEFINVLPASRRDLTSNHSKTAELSRASARQDAGGTLSWSLKHLHRLIVTSATYRQCSRVRPELAAIDPNNRLLARQSRLRLDAEVIRDVGLAASGLLSRKIGGPPVYPPQPDGVMNLGQVKRAWTTSTGEDRYRRALYTHWWRATPHPALAVFDAADGFSACTRRIRSNTPLQALTLLNDQQFNEFADALADRVLKGSFINAGGSIEYAFRLCLSRRPSTIEKQRLAQFFQQQFAQEGGDEKTRRKEAWKTMARVLLNLDETISRE